MRALVGPHAAALAVLAAAAPATALADGWLHLDASAGGGYDTNLFFDATKPASPGVHPPIADSTYDLAASLQLDLLAEAEDRVEFHYDPLFVNFGTPQNGWLTDHLLSFNFAKALSRRVSIVIDVGGELYAIAAFPEDFFLLGRAALGLRYRGDSFSLSAQLGAGLRSFPERTVNSHTGARQLDIESTPALLEARWNVLPSLSVLGSYRFTTRSSNYVAIDPTTTITLRALDGWNHDGYLAAALDLPANFEVMVGGFVDVKSLPWYPTLDPVTGATFVGRSDVAKGVLGSLRWTGLKPFAVRLDVRALDNASDDPAAVFGKTTAMLTLEYGWEGGKPAGRGEPSPGAPSLTPVATPQGYRFAAVAPRAHEVYLVGTFNHWRMKATPMHCDATGICTATVALRPGHHRYMLLIDGEWVTPGGARAYADDGYGRQNALLDVAEPDSENDAER